MPGGQKIMCPSCGQALGSCKCQSGGESSGPAALDELRQGLLHLQSEFDAKAASYPNFQHLLIETPHIDAYNEVNMAVPFVYQRSGREIRRLWHRPAEMQVFIDEDYQRGIKAYEAFWPLAELAVETLTASGLFRRTEGLPDPSELFWFEGKKNHFAKQWMALVHSVAKAHRGALPRVAFASFLEHFQLKQGGVVNTLTPAVFKASCLVVEQILNDDRLQKWMHLPRNVTTCTPLKGEDETRMTSKPDTTTADRVHRLLRDANALLGFLQRILLRATTRLTSDWEIHGAETVRDLARDLRSVENAELPVQVRLGIKRLRQVFFTLVARWKWDRVVLPEGGAYIDERWKMWKERRQTFYAAARSYVEAFVADEVEDRPADTYFYAAKEAEGEGIPAASPFVKSSAEVEATREAWVFSPFLGPEFPMLGQGEYAALQRAVFDIGEGVRGTAWEATPVDSSAESSVRLNDPVLPDHRVKHDTRPAHDQGMAIVRDLAFISYSHSDETYLNELLTHLKPYMRNGAITHWSDVQIEPGQKWFDKIKAALARTSVALMLVSPKFIESEFIREYELEPLLKEAESGEVRIFWVLVHDCSWKMTALTKFQAVISPDRPLAKLRKAERNTAWRKICEKLRQAMDRPSSA